MRRALFHLTRPCSAWGSTACWLAGFCFYNGAKAGQSEPASWDSSAVRAGSVSPVELELAARSTFQVKGPQMLFESFHSHTYVCRGLHAKTQGLMEHSMRCCRYHTPCTAITGNSEAS